MPRRVSTEAPTDLSTPAGRGQMLRHLIAGKQRSAPAFAARCGLSRSTLDALLRGVNDVARAEAPTVRALCTGLAQSGEALARSLQLDAETTQQWGMWVPARPAAAAVVAGPVTGVLAVPAGWVLHLTAKPVRTAEGFPVGVWALPDGSHMTVCVPAPPTRPGGTLGALGVFLGWVSLAALDAPLDA